MSIDCPHIECRFHHDPRLMVGVATIIEHAAAHAGLAKQDQHKLADATARACEEGFCRLSRCGKRAEDCMLRMGVSTFWDRVEVELEFADDAVRPSHIPLESSAHSPVKLVQHRAAS